LSAKSFIRFMLKILAHFPRVCLCHFLTGYLD